MPDAVKECASQVGVKHAAISVCRVEPRPTQRANRSRAWLDSTGDACLAWRRLPQKSIVADTSTVLGAPSARLDNNGMPQYALLVTLFTLARSASDRRATVVL